MSSATELVGQFQNHNAQVMVVPLDSGATDDRIGIYTINKQKMSEAWLLNDIMEITSLDHLVIVADYYRDQDVTIYYGYNIFEQLYGEETDS